MHASLAQILIFMLVGIAVIVVLTARYRVNAFFALLLACFIVGLGVGLPVAGIVTMVKDGFSNILKSLGVLIVLGTTLGTILEHTGATQVMAASILKRVGERRAPLAMNITGFIVGLPIFCDSGYIVLSGLNNSLARKTGQSIATMAASLATGLYAVHCLIPPHPGASAAASLLKVDFGRLIMFGVLVAVPAAIVGYWWSKRAGSTISDASPATHETEMHNGPRASVAFLPIIIPILLIAAKYFLSNGNVQSKTFTSVFNAIGDPIIALAIGIVLALLCKKSWTSPELTRLLHDGVEKAGGILIVIGAGGAFGAILAATKIGDQLATLSFLQHMGLFFPFLLTALLKTAQGSSTVAIIAAASIVEPLLPSLGLNVGNGPLLTVLALGAGSMMISHANDAYFWVIAKFSGMSMRSMLRVYTVSTICMGIVSFLSVLILSKLL
jgi:gluconate:H+ symporter, GntP family